MVLALSGIWPLAEDQKREPNPTAEAIRLGGLVAEKAGEPRRDGNQIYVPVKVTNNYRASLAPPGTPTPGVATPEPSNVDVEFAIVTVMFYGQRVGNGPAPLLGRADGQVLELPFGQSKTVEVVGIGIPPYNDWEPVVTAVQPKMSAP
jgi:hypothetical protein